MRTTGKLVTRSDGATYPSIAAAAKSNGVAVITISRSVKSGKPLRSGYSFTACKQPPRPRKHTNSLYEPTICPMCGKPTRNVSGFCYGCYQKLSAVNRKEDAYRAARVCA